MTRIVAVVCVGVLAVALAGCWEYPVQDAIDVRIDGERIEVVNCGQETAGPPIDVLFEVAPAPSEEWIPAFTAHEANTFGPGDSISNDEESWDAPTVEPFPELTPGSAVAITVDADNGRVSANYVVPSEGLKQGEWLSHDGGVVAEPCQ